jgi:2'-5' RNA ligase
MPRMRTFIAVRLPDDIRARLVVMQDTLAPAAPDLNRLEPENMHITLLFLGEVDDRELPAICRATQTAVLQRAAFSLTIEGLGCFPNPRRPNVLWVGVGEGAQEVVAIHDALEAPLLELGCYRREARKYTPHVTLGRLRGEESSDALAKALAKHKDWKAGELGVSEIHVMSSQLTSRGPIYAVLSRAKLS